MLEVPGLDLWAGRAGLASALSSRGTQREMFRRKIRSALFIDFQNIAGQLGAEFAQSMSAWLAWLEDGAFDPGGKGRRLVERRIYCDAPNHKKHAATFAQYDFVAIPTAADLSIALDALETTYLNKRIKEYIVLTVDQDFAPLLEKLGDRQKDRVVTIQEGTPSALNFPDRADIVIPLRHLREAFTYKRPPTLLTRARDAVAGLKERGTKLRHAVRRMRRRVGKSQAIKVGAEHLSTLARKTPKSEVGRRTVLNYLATHMPEWQSAGRFLGCEDYASMVQQMVEVRDDLLLIRKSNGGVGIMAAPRDE
jgi:NYN domain